MSDPCGEPYNHGTWTDYCGNDAANTIDGDIFRCEWCHRSEMRFRILQDLMREILDCSIDDASPEEAAVRRAETRLKEIQGE